jgi:hypothetical protein
LHAANERGEHALSRTIKMGFEAFPPTKEKRKEKGNPFTSMT